MNWLEATRAVAHATVAAVITFNQVHNGELGMNSLILFAVLYLAASLGTHLLDKRHKLMSPRLGLPVFAPTLVGITALVLVFTKVNQIVAFRWLTAALALGFVITELWLANKVGRKTVDGRDAIITAFVSLALLGLTAGIDVGQVPLVGFFGAFHAILAVHLGISATSPKK